MPLHEKQKCKILYLKKILEERTDPDHALSMDDLIRALEEYEIPAERKSVYRDLGVLEDYGMPIERTSGRTTKYYLDANEFQLPELKLLIDAVQASRFITQKKSGELIRKLTKLTSRYQAQTVRQQVFVSHRVKTDNESIYYAVDCIHDSISNDVRITFQYYEWTPKIEKELRHDGQFYTVSPFALSWAEENYYLIAYDEASAGIRHYRVDKMLRVSKTAERRTGHDVFRDFDMAEYDRETFGMYGGERKSVRLGFPAGLAGVIIDRFGEEIRMIPEGDAWSVAVPVQISPNFFSWITRFEGRVQILSPRDVKEQYRVFLDRNAPMD